MHVKVEGFYEFKPIRRGSSFITRIVTPIKNSSKNEVDPFGEDNYDFIWSLIDDHRKVVRDYMKKYSLVMIQLCILQLDYVECNKPA
jgi:hypothetical protein